MTNETPPISAMCLTFGRPQVLEEAIESFLRQDYPGVKELLVLNDCAHQTLICDHPEVVVINIPKRFRTVGEKRNACAALASHDLFFVWDDDDIFLPHRISFSVQHLDIAKGFFKPSKALMLNNGVVSGPKSNLFHSGGCFTRDLFNRAHGYAHMGSGQDMDIENAIERLIGRGKNYNAIKPQEIFYLYRWGGTGSFHLSGFGRDKPGETTGNERVANYVQQQLEKGKIPTGIVRLEPKWKADYCRLVADFVQTLS